MSLLRPLVVMLVALLILGSGVLIPVLVSPLPAGRSADERVFARHALRDAFNLLNNPVRRLLTRRLRVVSVTPEGEGDCGEIPFVSRRRYRGRVQALTLFGISYQTLLVTCESVQMVGRE